MLIQYFQENQALLLKNSSLSSHMLRIYVLHSLVYISSSFFITHLCANTKVCTQKESSKILLAILQQLDEKWDGVKDNPMCTLLFSQVRVLFRSCAFSLANRPQTNINPQNLVLQFTEVTKISLQHKQEFRGNSVPSVLCYFLSSSLPNQSDSCFALYMYTNLNFCFLSSTQQQVLANHYLAYTSQARTVTIKWYIP